MWKTSYTPGMMSIQSIIPLNTGRWLLLNVTVVELLFYVTDNTEPCRMRRRQTEHILDKCKEKYSKKEVCIDFGMGKGKVCVWWL
jgi:hypothetical protein